MRADAHYVEERDSALFSAPSGASMCARSTPYTGRVTIVRPLTSWSRCAARCAAALVGEEPRGPRILAAATNVPSTQREEAPIRPERPRTDIAFGAFADCLTAGASSAGPGERFGPDPVSGDRSGAGRSGSRSIPAPRSSSPQGRGQPGTAERVGLSRRVDEPVDRDSRSGESLDSPSRWRIGSGRV
jgi:hypothetical protein